MKKIRKILYSFIVSAALLIVPVNTWSGDGIAAYTIPSADVILSFIQPGLIAKVHVREGDRVSANQVLIRQDDAVDQARLSQIKEQIENTTQIETRKASLAQKKLYLERLEWAAERGSVTELEVEDAKLEVKIAEFALKSAEFEHEQNIRKYNETKLRIDNMSLKSPIAGRVEKVEVEVGESIDGIAKAVRVVKTDPLWIDAHIPIEQSKAIRLGQTVRVIFPGTEQKASTGSIIFISTVADAASSTLRARIEVPNDSNRPAGEHVIITFLTQSEEVETNKLENK